MPKYSLVTCVSNPITYAECTLGSINKERHNHNIEIIPIINNDNRYSASNALNIGIDVSRSDIIVFMHQDIKLLPGWFDKLDMAVSNIPNNWGIVGCAGISAEYGRSSIGKWGGSLSGDSVAVGSVYNDDVSEKPYWDGSKTTQPVHCIDECVFVLRKSTGLRFDSMFNGFHFYGVDICLQSRAAGYLVYAADLPIIHYGKYSASFTGDSRYWHYYRFLHHKWHLRFPELLGTHMHWSKGELTSYIPVSMSDDDGNEIDIRSAGIVSAKFKSDKNQGYVDA